MESPIPVYVLSAQPKGTRSANVSKFFAHPNFKVQEKHIDLPADYSHKRIGSNLSQKQFLEAYRVMTCLEEARRHYPHQPCIVIKDTSACHAEPARVADVITTALGASGWDVCYLCRWLDRCDLYQSGTPVPDSQTYVVRTQAPQGLQAILFTPRGRDMVLGEANLRNGQKFTPVRQPIGYALTEHIGKGTIHATCIVPNLIEFDLSAAQSPHDHLKVAECLPTVNLPVVPDTLPPGPRPGPIPVPVPVPGPEPTPDDSSTGKVPTWVWVLLLFGLLLLLLWWLSRRHANPKNIIIAKSAACGTPKVAACGRAPASGQVAGGRTPCRSGIIAVPSSYMY